VNASIVNFTRTSWKQFPSSVYLPNGYRGLLSQYRGQSVKQPFTFI
jgi:hypothetical protein